MADESKESAEKRPRETSTGDGQRRNPRFPRSKVWSDEQRAEHREQRDSTLEDAGLVTDRMLDTGKD